MSYYRVVRCLVKENLRNIRIKMFKYIFIFKFYLVQYRYRLYCRDFFAYIYKNSLKILHSHYSYSLI